MRLVKALVAVLVVAAAFGGGYVLARRSAGGGSARTSERKVLYWVDPMHPAYKSDKPGVAPDCGMKLEPVYADGAVPAAAGQPQGKILYYRDPQNQAYHSDKPGINPETGNDLEPVYENTPATTPLGSLHISADKQQMIGVTYATAEYAEAGKSIRANARVAADETRVTHVHVRTEGWIENVFVDFTGQPVAKGQKLLTMYSPELLASQQEYLVALRGRDMLRDSTLPSALRNSDSLLDAARRRLELWDLTSAEIDEVKQTGKPNASTTLYAPHGGYVLTRNAFARQKITPDTELYTLVDLSSVWIVADVFESDAAFVRPGTAVAVNIPAYPGKTILGHVSFILPQVDPQTRTLKVRIEAPNPGLILKPDMFVDAELRTGAGRKLMVPASAVLDTGERRIVFVDLGNGVLDRRDIDTGERFGDRIAVLRGLKQGERVVASANFLIDSESQLRGAITGSGSPPTSGEGHDAHD